MYWTKHKGSTTAWYVVPERVQHNLLPILERLDHCLKYPFCHDICGLAWRTSLYFCTTSRANGIKKFAFHGFVWAVFRHIYGKGSGYITKTKPKWWSCPKVMPICTITCSKISLTVPVTTTYDLSHPERIDVIQCQCKASEKKCITDACSC